MALLFRDESLKEFARVYDLLDIEFDSYNGESLTIPNGTCIIFLAHSNPTSSKTLNNCWKCKLCCEPTTYIHFSKS